MVRKKYFTDEERKAAHRESRRKYYERHKEEELERIKEYNKNHKDKITEYHRNYYKDNKNKLYEQQKQYRLTAFGRATYLISGYQQQDSRTNRGECTIDTKWIMDNVFSGQCCIYCGETDYMKLGVDRKDSSLPHTPENCVPCCAACNIKKHTTKYEEYLKRIGKSKQLVQLEFDFDTP